MSLAQGEMRVVWRGIGEIDWATGGHGMIGACAFTQSVFQSLRTLVSTPTVEEERSTTLNSCADQVHGNMRQVEVTLTDPKAAGQLCC